jgi:uncharacterized protein with ATP-grasp and redox domains
MRTVIDCYSCFIRQGLQAARLAGADPEDQDRCVRAIMGYLLGSNPHESPVEVARAVQEIVTRITGVRDPYASGKERSNWQAAEWIRRAEEKLAASPADGFERALRLAIAGNIIDFGPDPDFDLEATLERCLREPFGINQGLLLMERLEGARSLAYLGDNAGEIAFDQLLLSFLLKRFNLKEVLFVVRERPFLNDALLADSARFNLNCEDAVEVVEMGPGKPEPGSAGWDVWERIKAADVRIAKGQANAEAFDEERDFFLLFMVKCPVVARSIEDRGWGQVRKGEMVLLHTGEDENGVRRSSAG